MAITDLNEIWSGRDGEEDAKVRRYSRVFRAWSDDPSDTSKTVLAAIGIAIGATYPTDSKAWCQRRAARNESVSRKQWTAEYGYSSEREITENPLNEPARITWDGEDRQKPLIIDPNTGQLVLNSAGYYFDPPVIIDDPRSVATVVKNVANVPSWVLQYKNCTNTDSFSLDGITIAPFQAKIKFIRISDWQEQNEIEYRQLTIPIHLEEQGWQVTAIDMGYYQIDPNNVLNRIPCLDSQGGNATVPMPLDGLGAQLANPSPLNAVALTFGGYRKLPFSPLPLA